MRRRVCAAVAGMMLLAAMAFVGYALQNPQAAFPWGNGVTYAIYAAYAAVMIGLAVAAIRTKKHKKE